MKKRFLIVLLILFILVISCTTKDTKTYTNADFKYSIKYPATWELKEEMIGPVPITFLISPLESPDDKFRENFNFIVSVMRDIPSTALEQYTQGMLYGILQDSKNNIVKKGPTTLDGLPAQEVVFTTTTQGFKLRYFQIWTIKGNKIYQVTFTAEDAKYDQSWPEIQKILDSLKLR